MVKRASREANASFDRFFYGKMLKRHYLWVFYTTKI